MHFLKCTVHTYYETQYIIPAATFPSTVVGAHPFGRKICSSNPLHLPPLRAVDGRNPAPLEAGGSLSHYLQGFIHSRWLFRILPSTG